MAFGKVDPKEIAKLFAPQKPIVEPYDPKKKRKEEQAAKFVDATIKRFESGIRNTTELVEEIYPGKVINVVPERYDDAVVATTYANELDKYRKTYMDNYYCVATSGILFPEKQWALSFNGKDGTKRVY